MHGCFDALFHVDLYLQQENEDVCSESLSSDDDFAAYS